MEVKIKSIGWNKGTVGWLAEGLKNGTLRVEEGALKSNGNHGLWLQGEQVQFLAAFNRYNLKLNDFEDADKYEKAYEYEDRDPVWTDAAWEKLMEIAQKWCDEQNALRENDKLVEA